MQCVIYSAFASVQVCAQYCASLLVCVCTYREVTAESMSTLFFVFLCVFLSLWAAWWLRPTVPLAAPPQGERKTWNLGRQHQVSSQITALGTEAKQWLHHSQTSCPVIQLTVKFSNSRLQLIWVGSWLWHNSNPPQKCQGYSASVSLLWVCHFGDLKCLDLCLHSVRLCTSFNLFFTGISCNRKT